MVMDCRPDYEVCDCQCHRFPGFEHIINCCNNCPYCHRNIKTFFFDEHVVECAQKASGLLCISDSELCDCEYHQLPAHCRPPCCMECPYCKLHIKKTSLTKHLEKCSKNRQ